MAKTPREMREAIISNLPKNTGKSLQEWLAILKKDGPGDPKEARTWLKERHGLGHGQAGMIAAELTGGPNFAVKSPEQLVAEQYAGKKEGLRPIFEAVVAFGRTLGKDVRVEPCSGSVPLLRGKQFVVIRASTAKRIDVGLALGEAPAKGKLQKQGVQGTSERITHRIELSSLDEFDAEVRTWIKKSYDTNAPK